MALKNKKDKNFSEWYTEVLIKSGFVDYSAVSGSMVLRPMLYAIWEKIVAELNQRFKKLGVKNVYFPTLIPEKLLVKESKHFEGFNPEVAWVTYAGKNKLDERLAVRPTSETIMYDSYSKWIRSWRDLPLKLNQWVNIIRWEFKHPVPLLRGREFLWNEGHTAYATKEEAEKEKGRILKIYEEVQEKFLALPGILGEKTNKENFAGAINSYSIEHILPSGKGIQGPSFHSDGQKFAKVFDITFLDKNEKKQYVWQNTWGFSTRQIGIMATIHGDDKGLIIPPNVAPIQIVIVPIYNAKTKDKVLAEANKIKAKLKSFSVKLDNREGYSPGWKFNEWELKGIPLRLEIGPKDIVGKQVVLVRRDTGKKEKIKISELNSEVKKALNGIQNSLFKKARKFLEDNVTKVSSYDEFKKILNKKKGIIAASWCGEQACEDKIKDETGAKITNIPFQQGRVSNCISCRKEGKYIANFAKSY